MKTTNIREFRHAMAMVLEWVEKGETVQITRRNKVVALLTPPVPEKVTRIRRHDFEKSLHDIFGEKAAPTTGTELMDYDRGER